MNKFTGTTSNVGVESKKEGSGSKENSNKTDEYIFELDKNGKLTIKKDGKIINSFDIRGPKGETGDNGVKGPQGDIGVQGKQGIPGLDGNTWTPIVTDDGQRLYFEDKEGKLTPEFQIRGERGEHGDKGPAGDTGERGIQGEPGINGTNGDTWIPIVSDDGECIYFENQNGDKTPSYQIRGKQGVQGIKGDKGDKGEQGPVGPNGTDGETWSPIISDDGEQLYFVNTKGDKSPIFHIRGHRGYQGMQGQPGLKGDKGNTYKPHFDGEWLWFEDEDGNKPFSPIHVKGDTGEVGPQGKSAYELWRDDPLHPENAEKSLDDYRQAIHGLDGHNVTATHDYLKDLKDWTCPVKSINPHMIVSTDSIEGADSAEQTIEQEKAKINSVRKEGDKYHNHGSWIQEFFWWCSGADRPLLRMCYGEHSKYMGIGTVIFFTALMAWFSSFVALGYVTGEQDKPKPIFGVVLPVLILSLGFILGFLSYKFMKMKRVIAHEESQNKDTEKERLSDATYRSTKRYMWKIGILLVALIALTIIDLTCLKSSFSQISWAAVFACAWSMMIFFLDRFITNTMYSDGKVTISWLEIRSALPRIVIAIFLGIVISAPLELIIFHQEINDKLYAKVSDEIETTIDSEITKNEGLKRLKNIKSRAEKELKFVENERDITLKHQGDTLLFHINSKPSVKTTVNDHKNNTSKTTETKQGNNGLYSPEKYDARLNDNNKNVAQKKKEFLAADSVLLCATKDTLAHLKSSYHVNDLVNKAGLYDRLRALHKLAFFDNDKDDYYYQPWDTSIRVDNPYNPMYWALGTFCILLIMTWPFMANVYPIRKREKDDNNEEWAEIYKEDYEINFRRGITIVWPCLFVIALTCGYCNETLFHALPSYIFSAVGLIMMLFILIDVSPVFYKMMLADGVYDKLLHKEKLLTEDAVRLSAAKAYANVTNSDIGRLAPFVFGRTSKKLKDFLGRKIALKSDESESIDDKKRKEEGKPEMAWESNYYTDVIDDENRETFEYVLSLKKRIVEASYLAWYRDQRDSILGMVEHKDDPGNPEDTFTEFNDKGNASTPPPDEESTAEKSESHATDGQTSENDTSNKEESNSKNEDTSADDASISEEKTEENTNPESEESTTENNSETKNQAENETEESHSIESHEDEEHVVNDNGESVASDTEKSSASTSSSTDKMDRNEEDDEEEVKTDETFTTK